MASPNKVNGTRNSEYHVMLYTLSTCVWCKKAKRLLNDLGVSYEYVDVDGLSGQDKTEMIGELERFNPRCTFPTMVIDDKECIVGFKEEKIKEALS